MGGQSGATGSSAGFGQKLANVFTGNNDMVNGTTQTAGQWKQQGLSQGDINQLGTSPTTGTQIARGIIKAGLGAAQGWGNSAQGQWGQRQMGGGGYIAPAQQIQAPQSSPQNYTANYQSSPYGAFGLPYRKIDTSGAFFGG